MNDRELDAWLGKRLGIHTLYEDVGDGIWGATSTGNGMLLVVEAMRERGWGMEIVTIANGKFSVDFMRESNDEPDAQYSHGYGDSLPRAVAEVANAALESVDA